MDYSERLREVRQEKGMTQSELARRLDVHPITVSNWERGHRNWLSSLAEIAAALEVSPAVLVVDHREATLIDSVMDFLRSDDAQAKDNSHMSEHPAAIIATLERDLVAV